MLYSGQLLHSNCQLRYANKRWGKKLTDKGKTWLKSRGMQIPPHQPDFPPPPAAPFTQAAHNMPTTMPFPNPWAGGMGMAPLANLGITIPPRFPIQLNTSGRMDMPRHQPFGGMEGGFQLGMQMATMQGHCQHMQPRLESHRAQQGLHGN